jgi:hypothetical protein
MRFATLSMGLVTKEKTGKKIEVRLTGLGYVFVENSPE